MALIFLSHTEVDFPFVERIAQGLEGAGCFTWLYERDTVLGTSYLLQITRAIESCDALVLIASPNSITSDQVTKEIIGAFERDIPILPVLLDLTPAELKTRQPEWRHALGGTAMLTVSEETLPKAVSDIVEGLATIGTRPGKPEAPSAPVLSTPGTHAAKALTDRVLSQRAALEGERKQVTVLVVGLQAPSSMDAEDLHELIGPLSDLLSQEVHRYEGTVASISAEGLTALFGAPITHEDDPRRALHAALSLGEIAKERGLLFSAGVNTGLVIVGTIEDDLAMEYTPVGDTISQASQIRDVAASGTVLASEDTFRLAEGYFEFEPVGEGLSRAYKVLSPSTADTRLEASLTKGFSHFVGRQRELAHLSECLERAASGEGQVVGIVGEAGVGKSRLIYEFAAPLRSDGYTLLRGGCYHYGDAIPYLPILEVVKDFFDLGESDDEQTIREKLAQGLARYQALEDEMLPPLQEVLSLKVEDQAYMSLEPQLRRQRVFEAIRILLISESQAKPLIVVIEDLHWIDRTSEEFLTALIDSIANSRMLIILLYRPEYTSPWSSKTYYSQVRVDQLPRRTSADLVVAILTGGEVAPEISDLIVEKASGNPLFIEELTHGLLENGSIVKEDDCYALALKAADIEVPDTIQGIIAARLDRLEENLKRIVQVASVIGREFAYRLLQMITSLQDELKDSLSNLQSLEFIYEKNLFPELEYIFKHALTQEVAYSSLLKKRRKELHGEIGEAIEALYPERLEELYEMLAYHLARSNDTEKAVHYLKLSGDKATRSYSNWEAIRFYKEALHILDTRPDTDGSTRKKLDICLALMEPIMMLSFPEGSSQILDEAEKLARDLGDDEALLAIYHSYSLSGNVSLGLDFSEKYFEQAEKVGAGDVIAEIARQSCSLYFLIGDLPKCTDIARRALHHLDQRPDDDSLCLGSQTTFSVISGWCGLSLGMMGDFDDATLVLEKGRENSKKVDDAFGLGFAEVGELSIYLWAGDGDLEIAHAKKAIEYFEKTGIGMMLGASWSLTGIGHLFNGDVESAKFFAEKGSNLQAETGVPILMPLCQWISAIIHLAQGDLLNASVCAEASLAFSREYQTKIYEAFALVALGRIMGESNPSQIEIAEHEIREGLSMAEGMRLRPLMALGHLFLGELLTDADRSRDAIDNLQEADAKWREVGTTGYWLTRTQEALGRLGH